MVINIKLNYPYSKAINSNHLKISIDEEYTNMYEIIEKLVVAYPELLELMTTEGVPKAILVTINGHLGELDTMVCDGDEIRFLYPCTGG